jgi:hypothetical protein
MSKNRNPDTKRKPESPERPKAAGQLEKKQPSKQNSVNAVEPNSEGTDNLASQFSESELRVLDHFRRYRMAPGEMLCLNGQQIDSMGPGLDALIARRLLLPEGARSAYYLTHDGFEVMHALASH